MSLAKNFYDSSPRPKSKTRNLVTTISGIATLIVTILVTVGVLTAEQGTILNTQLGVAATAVSAIVGVVAAIIQMFHAVDPPTEPPV